MPVCARCGGTAFNQGVCLACGQGGRAPAPAARPLTPVARPAPAPTHTTSQGLILREITDDDPALPQAIVVRDPGLILRELPPEPLPAGIILRELEPEEDLIEGFEGTHIEARAPRARPPPPPPPPRRPPPALEAFAAEQCPSCATQLADPYAPFCDACGFKMPRVRRSAAALGPQTTQKCRRCGLANALDRAACTNCGQRL